MNPRKYSRLEVLTRDMFADRLIVTLDGEIWTDKPLDEALLRDVRMNWPALLSMMEDGSLWLCPTHELHKPFWKFVDGRWLCLACKQLHPEVVKKVC